MARISVRKRSNRGFTLVELLIVVAIIGVLSTIGVPTFKKMVQKSKKSEAKVALGGLYTAEQAFFSEYGSYGNNTSGVGFEMEGTNGIYLTGFTADTNCGNPTIFPATGAEPGDSINRVYSAYYQNPVFTQGGSAAKALTSGCWAATVTNGTFLAMSAGVIAPGVDRISPNTGSDVWTMNHTRTLANVRDGVNATSTGSGSGSGTGSGTGTGGG